MVYLAGLDVSVKETRICIVDDTGKIGREARVASEAEALLQVLTKHHLWLQASWARTAVAVATRVKDGKKIPIVETSDPQKPATR